MSRTITIEPLSAEAFAPFGEVIEARGDPTVVINRGKCHRWTDLAKLDFADGRAGISIFVGQPCTLPLKLEMVERHPQGSQAFLPLSTDPFLVVVAPDRDGTPDTPRAFLTRPGQGVNYRRNLWHAVLTPILEVQDFLVVDRGGEGNNLEEYYFDEPYLIELPETAND